MPRHDFTCTQCGNAFEEAIPFKGALPPCPACGSSDVKKEIAIPGVIFKGEGFYKTAERKKPETSAIKKEDDSSPQKKTVTTENKSSSDTCGGGCCECGSK